MEFLVTMTTHVPDGTADAAVEDVRAREAARSRELAAARASPPPLATSPAAGRMAHASACSTPPTGPGSRTCSSPCLCACGAPTSSQPLVAALRTTRARQPAGPSSAAGAGSEFLTTFTITVPPGTPSGRVDAGQANEAERAA